MKKEILKCQECNKSLTPESAGSNTDKCNQCRLAKWASGFRKEKNFNLRDMPLINQELE